MFPVTYHKIGDIYGAIDMHITNETFVLNEEEHELLVEQLIKPEMGWALGDIPWARLTLEQRVGLVEEMLQKSKSSREVSNFESVLYNFLQK
jgi:hypothetical protein